MKKFIVFLVFLILLTGCEINYIRDSTNVRVNDEIDAEVDSKVAVPHKLPSITDGTPNDK